MAIVTLAEAKSHLRVEFDDDDEDIEAYVDAAQAHLETMLGYEIAEEFEAPPADLKEAVRQIAARFYENREAVVTGTIATELPIGVQDIVRSRRRYTFDVADE